MKSKSEIQKNAADNVKHITHDFEKYYKTASNINVNLVEKRISDAGSLKENIISNKLLTPKREGKKNKKFQNSIADTFKINSYGDSLSYANETASLDDSKITSTPNVVKKNSKPKVKSVIKNKSLIESSMEVSQVSMSNKPKKRNKTVSFMLDDTEEIAIKKCKSEKTLRNLVITDKSLGKIKKSKKNMQDEKENKNNHKNKAIDNNIPSANLATTSKINIENNPDNNEIQEMPNKKHLNKVKEVKTVTLEVANSDILKKEGKEANIKKIRKKKRHVMPTELGTDNAETEGEPAQKSSKKEVKPEKIAQDLQNLNIGDNAHTLTNLLDEMTVVDKNKKKKNKQKIKDRERKEKKYNPTSTNSEGEDAEKSKGKDKKHKMNNAINTNTEQSTNIEGEVSEEKEKWVKRKWNKDKKGGASVDKHLTSVIVENLPLNIMFTYKKLLAEHFEKFGMIRQVGIAEMYPTEDPKPVFTTTINFYSEDGAEKALEEDNTVLEGARIRVKRPHPPTLTTLVVRSYADLTDQGLSSVFSGAGRIRSIRHLVKGKKSLSTAFIEFDGPKSVERAIKMTDEAKIGGKKIHVAKYELRAANKKRRDQSQGDKEDSDISNE